MNFWSRTSSKTFNRYSVISKTKINQWKNTTSVLKWFNSLQHKESLSFICFDVCDFYPSITEKLLCKALDFANSYRPISQHERDIIIHAKRSLLFSKHVPWEKKNSNDRFDVTMGSFDGAETLSSAEASLYCGEAFVLWGGWGERKRERAGHDEKGEERREASAI